MKNKGLLAIVLVFGFLFSIFFLFVLLVASSSGGDELAINGEGIGVVEVIGPIMDSRQTVEQIERFERSDAIKGIIIRIDSPGGAVAPSQEIHRAVERASDTKRVVVSMGNTAASGGYYIACAADKIFANRGSVTGSIGVVTQLTNFEQLKELAQVEVHTITSGQYKDTGNPFREFTEQDRAFFQQLVLNIYEQFISDIARSRDMDLDKVRELADGRIYTGEQAKENGLIDELGSLQDAAEYLAKEVNLSTPPNLVYPTTEDEELLSKLLQGSARSLTEGLIQGINEQSTPRIEYRYTGPQ